MYPNDDDDDDIESSRQQWQPESSHQSEARSDTDQSSTISQQTEQTQSTVGPSASDAVDPVTPYQRGIVYGTIAVAVTYLTHLYMTMVSSSLVPSTAETGHVSVLTSAGWSYLSVFGVGFQADGESAGLDVAIGNLAPLSNPIQTSPTFFAPQGSDPFLFADTLVVLVTICLPILMGYFLARNIEPDTVTQAAKAGITIVIPYFVFAVIAGLLFAHTYDSIDTVGEIANAVEGLDSNSYSDGDELTFAPSVPQTVLFAGLLFPTTFGVLGALITQSQETIARITGNFPD